MLVESIGRNNENIARYSLFSFSKLQVVFICKTKITSGKRSFIFFMLFKNIVYTEAIQPLFF